MSPSPGTPCRPRSRGVFLVTLVLSLLAGVAPAAAQIPVGVGLRGGQASAQGALGSNGSAQGMGSVVLMFHFTPRVGMYASAARYQVECSVAACYNSVATVDQFGGGIRATLPIFRFMGWAEAGGLRGSVSQEGFLGDFSRRDADTSGGIGFRAAVGADVVLGDFTVGPFFAYEHLGRLGDSEVSMIAGDRSVESISFGIQLGYQPFLRTSRRRR